MRVLWMAAELGLDFEHDPVAFDDPALKTATFLALNPAGAIPTIQDDGFTLAESLAIRLFAAMAAAAHGVAKPDAADRLADVVERVGGRPGDFA